MCWLFLVFAYWDDIGVVKENIRSHERWISKKGVVGRDPLRDFVLV